MYISLYFIAFRVFTEHGQVWIATSVLERYRRYSILDLLIFRFLESKNHFFPGAGESTYHPPGSFLQNIKQIQIALMVTTVIPQSRCLTVPAGCMNSIHDGKRGLCTSWGKLLTTCHGRAAFQALSIASTPPPVWAWLIPNWDKQNKLYKFYQIPGPLTLALRTLGPWPHVTCPIRLL